MATSGVARVSGLVLSHVDRSGTSKKGDPYAFRTLNVLVGGKGTVEVTVHKDSDFLGGSALPTDGEYIDFTVAVRSNSFGLNVTALDIYSELAISSK